MARTARVVAFSTTPDMADRIDRMASELGSSRSQVMRAAFELYAQAEQATQADLQIRDVESLNGAVLAAEPAVAFGPSTSAPHRSSLPGLAQVLAHRDEIRVLCQEFGVRRLWLYGSAVREDFVPGRSDFDFQVEWEQDAQHDAWATELFDLRTGLSRALSSQKVDLGEVATIKNPYVRAAIEGERLLIHESAG